MDLVSVLVEPIDELPLWCAEPLPVDCASSQVDMDQVLATVCTELVKRLKGRMPFLSIYLELARRPNPNVRPLRISAPPPLG